MRFKSKIEGHGYKDFLLGFIFYKYLSENEEKCLKTKKFRKYQ
ncbi:MAG: type I restriction-modification system subunit M N-terminal domain-containing protein [Negativicoccus succinicivorans]|nr:type I restriction-modification system subunit M N-terminal domain-containing protein [Negativicoccus succinicivorans]MDU1066732.1 type I restriction-modification system subunit M N-terminal domain-containing protein [Negativicoccus succinicivorans]MDU5288773.1 type I restriction-modification system subunit M N-terminal domain-containing protein [Negativicoccus succinicivorans]MDU5915668.1 type I restriction-modification system subunit M N-terminal domain-containing protein [Negativicoccus su